MRIYFKFFCTLGILLQWYSCATVVAPTGGPKDVIPPKVLSSKPSNFSTNFASSSVVINFDEYIQIKDLENQLIISPTMEKAPDIKIKGKAIRLNFNVPLKENTTYNINFSNAISDINEGNTIENFQYVFSTGDFIDSLYRVGKVVNAKTLVPEKDVLVLLYNHFEDSIPYKERPLYFAKTKENGSFKLTNLKKGKYKLFALKDANSNYLFDQSTEKIAFNTDSINADSKDTLRLRLFEDRDTRQHLVKAANDGLGKVVFSFLKPDDSPVLRIANVPETKKEWAITEYSKHRDTVIFWYTDPPSDTLHFIISYSDKRTDTVSVAIEKKDKKTKARFRLDIKSNIVNPFNMNAAVLLDLSHPIKNYRVSDLSLTVDTIQVTGYKFMQTDSTLRHFMIEYPWKENTDYTLLFPKKMFDDIYGLANDSVTYSFKTKSLDDYGKMNLKIESGYSGKFIVQLLDEKEHVIRENLLTDLSFEKINFTYLEPGKYILKIIEDRNGNGRWDSGSYLQKSQPETIIRYQETIVIRANWDIEIDWKLKP